MGGQDGGETKRTACPSGHPWDLALGDKGFFHLSSFPMFSRLAAVSAWDGVREPRASRALWGAGCQRDLFVSTKGVFSFSKNGVCYKLPSVSHQTRRPKTWVCGGGFGAEQILVTLQPWGGAFTATGLPAWGWPVQALYSCDHMAPGGKCRPSGTAVGPFPSCPASCGPWGPPAAGKSHSSAAVAAFPWLTFQVSSPKVKGKLWGSVQCGGPAVQVCTSPTFPDGNYPPSQGMGRGQSRCRGDRVSHWTA